MDRELAAKYILENFEARDRLAVVLQQKRTGSLLQRLGEAEKMASQQFQAWLRHNNAQGYEIYISMNALRDGATGRTKSDVATIRHVYLDFDENGTSAVEKLLPRADIPRPNYLINSSPDKWQVVWKVEAFGKAQAEDLQKALAQHTGADPAATDCARVLRLPGFYNHKYAKQHYIGVQSLSSETYRPERFPAIPAEERNLHLITGRTIHGSPKSRTASLSQSEKDWAYAKRALARGESIPDVIAAIASHRRYDKHNPVRAKIGAN